MIFMAHADRLSTYPCIQPSSKGRVIVLGTITRQKSPRQPLVSSTAIKRSLMGDRALEYML